MTASGRSEVSQIRTKRENETVSIGSRVTLRTEAQAHLVADGFEDISRLVRIDPRIRT